jgi:hypothetical protein
MAFNVKNLDITVRQGGRTQEGRYYEERRKEGYEVKGRYRPGGVLFKGVKNMKGGNGRREKKGKINWGKNSGLGDKATRG